MIEERDEALAARARDGDANAFRTLVERYRERLRVAASRRMPATLQARVASSDVVQECFLAAHRRLSDFEDRGEGSFARWLGRILRHKVRDEIRNHLGRARRNVNREIRLGSQTGARSFSDHAPSPGKRAQGKEERALVLESLAALSEDQQTVLRLVHESGLTIAQAADQMDRTAEAARKLYARAVAGLSKAVGARPARSP